MPGSRAQGLGWEKLAEKFLHGKGLRTVDRNYHSRFGEIDLIMIDNGTVVFTEVRYRGNRNYGSGAESVTFAKQRKIISAAQRFLQFSPAYRRSPCRFDVVSIATVDGQAELNWIRAAFDA